MEVLHGIHAVSEALNARGRAFEYVAVARERGDSRLRRIIESCRSAGVPLRLLAREELDRLAKTSSHQGVVAVASAKQYSDLEQLLARRRGRYALLVVLDGVEDPHNLGAILRAADGAGADGVVIPERRAVGITATVARTSAGAAEYLQVARVGNISRALEELKSRHLWLVGLEERAAKVYDQLEYQMDCALVLGAEGKGLRQHVRGQCDFLVSIPMLGKVPSLNVSVAAAIVMYEIARQRRDSSPASASRTELSPPESPSR